MGTDGGVTDFETSVSDEELCSLQGDDERETMKERRRDDDIDKDVMEWF